MIMKNGMQKKVRQIDYVTGQELEIYDSITDAANDNFITFDLLSHALRLRNGVMRYKKLRFEYVK